MLQEGDTRVPVAAVAQTAPLAAIRCREGRVTRSGATPMTCLDIVEKVRGPVMPDRRDPQVFWCQLAATPKSLATLRRRFANWLNHGFADNRQSSVVHRDLVLSLSELSWAAVDAGGERADRSLDISAWHEPQAIVMEVAEAVDDGSTFGDQQTDPLALSVVATLTDTLTIRRDEGHIRLRARMGRLAETRGVVPQA